LGNKVHNIDAAFVWEFQVFKFVVFFMKIIFVAYVAAYKLFEVSMHRERLRERGRHKEIGKGFSIMHNATTFGWKAHRAMWKKRTREERSVV